MGHDVTSGSVGIRTAQADRGASPFMTAAQMLRASTGSRYLSARSWNSPATRNRLGQMASHLSSGGAGTSLAELPKSHVFTSKLSPDPAFETPELSHKAPRETLGPRMVRGALFTYVRPEKAQNPELLGVSPAAMEDIGLSPGEERTPQFQALVAGNEIWWNEAEGGVYPWAQCYGGS